MKRSESGTSIIWVIIILVILAGIGAAGYWYWNRSQSPAATYQTTPVTIGDITQSVTATGALNPMKNVQVGSQISGIIKDLYADYNSPVKAGDVVAQLDPATFEAVVKQAEGDLANAKAGLEIADVNARRAQELRKQNATAQSTLDQAMATLHQAEAQVKVKEGALARARVDLDRCTIVSPVDGIVISRNVDVGQTVAASLQAPVLFTIANDLTKMQIDANIAEADIGNIELGQDVEFTVDAFPFRTFHGKVSQIRNAPITVQNVVTYDTVIAVNNDDLKLKPGMTANVSVVIAKREGVLRVSNSALRFRMPQPETTGTNRVASANGGGPTNSAAARGDAESAAPGRMGGGGRRAGGAGSRGSGGRSPERTIYVLRPNATTPEPVQVKTGITDGIFTEVVSGLAESDLTVTGSITPGAPATTQPSNPFGGGMRRF